MEQDKFMEWNSCTGIISTAKFLFKSLIGKVGTDILLKNITTMPVGLFVAEHDTLGTPLDNDWLASQLGNVVHHQVYKDMGHSSFLLGKNMSYVDNLVNLVKMHNK